MTLASGLFQSVQPDPASPIHVSSHRRQATCLPALTTDQPPGLPGGTARALLHPGRLSGNSRQSHGCMLAGLGLCCAHGLLAEGRRSQHSLAEASFYPGALVSLAGGRDCRHPACPVPVCCVDEAR